MNRFAHFSNPLVVLAMVTALALAACSTPSSAPAANNAPAATAAPTQAEAVATPTTAETAAAAPTEAPAEESTAENTEAASDPVVMTKLNLNTVTGDELLNTVPGFGNRMVREFQEYRPYISIQQFRREIGKYVDEAQVADYEQYVYVPVNVNEADAATVMQIPGVDESAADALIAARPYASNDAFLAKLAEVAPAVDGTVATSYLEAQ
ncbi:MAG: hypothetical protein R3C14_14910 [Caldilineaceae bacterium]